MMMMLTDYLYLTSVSEVDDSLYLQDIVDCSCNFELSQQLDSCGT